MVTAPDLIMSVSRCALPLEVLTCIYTHTTPSIGLMRYCLPSRTCGRLHTHSTILFPSRKQVLTQYASAYAYSLAEFICILDAVSFNSPFSWYEFPITRVAVLRWDCWRAQILSISQDHSSLLIVCCHEVLYMYLRCSFLSLFVFLFFFKLFYFLI